MFFRQPFVPPAARCCYLVRSRTVILLELTVPAEEGLQAAHLRKEAKYTKPLERTTETNFGKPTVDVGSRCSRSRCYSHVPRFHHLRFHCYSDKEAMQVAL